MSEAIGQRWTIGDEHNQVWGADLASATTIAPTHKYHRVSGASAVVNITVPYSTFSGPINLLATAAWTWTAAGNIAVASHAAMKVGQFVTMIYSPGQGLWYPSHLGDTT